MQEITLNDNQIQTLTLGKSAWITLYDHQDNTLDEVGLFIPEMLVDLLEDNCPLAKLWLALLATRLNIFKLSELRAALESGAPLIMLNCFNRDIVKNTRFTRQPKISSSISDEKNAQIQALFSCHSETQTILCNLYNKVDESIQMDINIEQNWLLRSPSGRLIKCQAYDAN
jgi:hypothetical protein